MLLIADTSPIISLILIGKLNILKALFPEFNLPYAVWEELNSHNQIKSFEKELNLLKPHVKKVNGFYFSFSGIDKGETEAIILYQELNASLLLIDDKKARTIAEMLDIKCFGTIALLSIAKRKGLIDKLRPVFIRLLKHKRYYSRKLLNEILLMDNEKIIG